MNGAWVIDTPRLRATATPLWSILTASLTIASFGTPEQQQAFHAHYIKGGPAGRPAPADA